MLVLPLHGAEIRTLTAVDRRRLFNFLAQTLRDRIVKHEYWRAAFDPWQHIELRL